MPKLDENTEIITSSDCYEKAPGKDGRNIDLKKYGAKSTQERVGVLIKKIWRK